MNKNDNCTMTFSKLDDCLSRVWGVFNNKKRVTEEKLQEKCTILGKTMLKNNFDECEEVDKAIAEVKNVDATIKLFEETLKEASAKIKEIIKEVDAEETAKQKTTP